MDALLVTRPTFTYFQKNAPNLFVESVLNTNEIRNIILTIDNMLKAYKSNYTNQVHTYIFLNKIPIAL